MIFLVSDLIDAFKNIELIYIKLNSVYFYAYLRFTTDNFSEEKVRDLEAASKVYDSFDQVVNEINKKIKGKYSPEYFLDLVHNKKYYNYRKILYNLSSIDKDHNALFNQISPYSEYQKILYPKVSIGKIKIDNMEVSLSHVNQLKYLMDSDYKIRKSTYNQFLEFYGSVGDRVAYLYRILVTKYNLESEAEGFKDYSQKYFSSNLGILYKKLSSYILDNADVIQKIVNQQRDVTGLASISYCDLYYEPQDEKFIISKQEAIKIVGNIFASFSEEWAIIFNKMVEERWIDWDSKLGKRSGGFSVNVFKAHPYILLNWTSDLNGLIALAHESIGAVINYQSRNVNFLNSQHSVFLTELYSQIMENEVKTVLINKFLNNDTMINKVKEKELLRFKDNVITPIINTRFEISSFSLPQLRMITFEKLSDIYKSGSEEIYDICDGFDSNEKNRFNWIGQAHIFNPFYDSSYVVTFFFSKIYKNKT